jgi:integrase
MLDLEFSLTKLAKQWNSGSHVTRSQRLYALCAMARTLVKELPYKALADANHLKPKHIQSLITHWQSNRLSTSTIKNNLSHLRTWSRWIGKEGLIPESNQALGVEKRDYTPEQTRAFTVSDAMREKIGDSRLLLAFELQQAFGLRREESLKLIPSMANQGTHLELSGSWCKNGKPRSIPIRTGEQRALLAKAQQATGLGRPVGAHLGSYKSAMKAYERVSLSAGMDGGHGLRHHYAQARYLELTGWASPIAGGPTSKQLSPDQKALDHEARMIVSHELGHAREQITVTYLGR